MSPSDGGDAGAGTGHVRRARVVVGLVAAVLTFIVGLSAFLVLRANDNSGGTGARITLGPDDLQTPINGADVGPKVGQVAPPFSLTGLDGGTVDLSAYAGRPIVVNFWASWCQPCRREFPILDAITEQYAAQGLVVIGVATNDTAPDARRFARDEGASWTLAYDNREQVAQVYGVKGRGLPQTFFIGPDGRVALRVFSELTAKNVGGYLDTILP